MQARILYPSLMIAKILSAIPQGYNGRIIEVEGDASRGLPAFNIVGMANKTIEESKERVRAAIRNSLFDFPDKKVTVNLAPAELHKDGAYLDLPIALAVLILSNQLLQANVADKLFVGELSLNGELRPIRGIINIVEAAKEAGITEIYLPRQNFSQASLVPDVNLIGVSDLKSVFLHLKGERKITPQSYVVNKTKTEVNPAAALDYIRGQPQAKRALTIAIAGRHNILISGPPGAGKTMLAKTALSLLPSPSNTEKIAITKIHSLTSSSQSIIHSRPFRAPHHTASSISLIGGGKQASPGEISLAHLGILFLDELPEYPRGFLEALRQPLEDRQISISRVNQKTTYPADFMLVATMNPCPCGFLGSSHECICTSQQIQNYHKKLSGPLLDRVDITINVAKVDNSDLLKQSPRALVEHEAALQQIASAASQQHARYQHKDVFNSSLGSRQVSRLLKLSQDAKSLLEKASTTLNLSARAYFKVIKIARTIADIESSSEISKSHISEALQYRQKIAQGP